MRREIDGFLDSARLGDTVLLYVSGHGVLSQSGQLFFAMVDTMLDRLRSTAVPGSFVHDVMTHSRAHRKVLILDCCHSGAFARGMSTKSDRQVHVGDRFQGRGHVTLTASDELEYALEEDHVESLGGAQANSLFTRLLVRRAAVGGGRRQRRRPRLRRRALRVRLRPHAGPHHEPDARHRGRRPRRDHHRHRPAAGRRRRGRAAAASPRARPKPQVANLLRRAARQAIARRPRVRPGGRRRGAAARPRLDRGPDRARRAAPPARGLRRGARGLRGRAGARPRRLRRPRGARPARRARRRGRRRPRRPRARDRARPRLPGRVLARGFVLAFAVPPRLAEAAADFEQVLALEPGQREAQAGAGWVATAEQPRQGARRLRARWPEGVDARPGLPVRAGGARLHARPPRPPRRGR